MRIGDVEISDLSHYFIAEAGVNHDGDLEKAAELVEIAADCGADAVKFQAFDTDRLVADGATTAGYQQERTGRESQREMLRQYELGPDAHETLRDLADRLGIAFLSTPFDRGSADVLADIGVPAMKIGSGEIDNYPLLRHVASLGLPMIVSTGMGTMEEVLAARNVIHETNQDVDLAFLHCTSEYPTSLADVNLRAMATMRRELSELVGYSDHTTHPATPAFAVAAGACIVEKHFTVDSSAPGPDHGMSLEPGELARAVRLVEDAATTRGHQEKQPTPGELENRTAARKSLHATRDISAGTRLSGDDVSVMRPATGLSPRHYDRVLGATTNRAIDAGEPLMAEDVDVDWKTDTSR